VTAGQWAVLTVRPHTAAVLLRGALRTEGVDARLDRDGLAQVYGLDSGLHATRVLVPATEFERARSVLASLDAVD
jgi:hypothetical protein